MAEIILYTKFRLRRGTSEAWQRVNPTLLYGEPGFEKDTNRLKIGDGVKDWNSLPYLDAEFTISSDEKTITYDNNEIKLCGYTSAELGQIASKGKDGLEWINPAESLTIEEISAICVGEDETENG